MLAATIYDPQAVASRLAAELPTWKLGDGCIERTYQTGAWPKTLMLVNAIGFLAEAACHHPDLVASYAQVTVRLCTHQPPGITDKDFELAELIEHHALWHPHAGAALEGYEKGFQKPWIK
jgi:4a-hydroxytetrahydrobiopterin dehydratase